MPRLREYRGSRYRLFGAGDLDLTGTSADNFEMDYLNSTILSGLRKSF